MIALACATAPCPACHGSGKRPSFNKEHGYVQICLACKGLRVVDADRVCRRCGQFIDHCICPPRQPGWL